MRDLMVLAFISLPLLLIAGGLLAVGSSMKSGWDGLTWSIYAVIVVAIWAAAVLAWCGWIVLRDGWQWSSLPPALVLLAAIAAAALWGGDRWLEQRRCAQSADFFTRFAQSRPQERPALLAENRRQVERPHRCGLDMIGYHLGLDHDGWPVSPAGDADRLAALKQLLDAGLPPEEGLLFNAASYGDREGLRLLNGARQRLNQAGARPAWPLHPPRVALAALKRLDRGGGSGGLDAADPDRRLQGILQDHVAGGGDLHGRLEGGPSLAERMTRAGLPWQAWQTDAAGAPRSPVSGAEP